MHDPASRPVVIRRTIVVHDQPRRGWIRATWRFVWHHRHVLLKFACVLFTADTAAMSGEVASDVTGVGLLDNLLMVVELPTEAVLFLFITFRLIWAWKKIRDCRYED